MAAQHSLGPTCRYYEPETTSDGDGPPNVNAQFFYISSVPIDDPLSPIPPAQSEKVSAKRPPQPFSSRDSAALEEAWQGFQSIVEPAKDAKTPRATTQRMVSFPKFTSGSKAKPAAGSEVSSPTEVATSREANKRSSEAKLASEPTPEDSLKTDSCPSHGPLRKSYDKFSKPPITVTHDDLVATDSPLGKLQNLKGSKLPDAGTETTSNGTRGPSGQADHKEAVAAKPKNIRDKHVPMAEGDGRSAEPRLESATNDTERSNYSTPTGKPPLNTPEKGRRKNWFSSDASEPEVMLSPDPQPDGMEISPIGTEELDKAERETSPRSKARRTLSPFRHLQKKQSSESKKDPEDTENGSEPSRKHKHRPKHIGVGKAQGDAAIDSDGSSPIHSGPDAATSISGRPFARAPSTRNLSKDAMDGPNDTDPYGEESEEPPHHQHSKFHQVFHPHPKPKESKKRAFISVGVSRLHLVEMPDLIMKPIYWSPINDQASVIRATWFFKETMEPVNAELANRLEAGFEDMKPYSDVYKHELDSCVEHGASAELKVVHKLWPQEKMPSCPPSLMDQVSHINQNEVREGDKAPPLNSEVNAAADRREPQPRGPYATHSVIYIDQENAQILKPSLLPNESRGRKPLASIRKGRPIGVPVVRGFDRKAWEKAHPSPKMSEKVAAAKVGGYMARSGDATTRDNRASCPMCDAQDNPPQPKHLVLVIHGIGQKLSERVDSYHFTHAINGLRREFNVELASEDIKNKLDEKPGIMVLPVNWRLNISFEDEEAKIKSTTTNGNKYGLSDITPDTLPAVRSLISDVMLDIPYYLSHHKTRMMAAVVKEANRVYRLWCRNNPGFQENGMVHLVAHSLGSVMAMDILSQQPTTVAKTLDLTKQPVNEKTFEFDTKSLFCCGSPSGFFLLLNNASLIPRKGRNKPGMEGEDSAPGIAGEAGSYGCLAVDNIYNICHKNDPIAYQQNACVDKAYAASLVPATIPTAGMSMLARMGGALRITSSSMSNPYDNTVSAQRPTMVQLPSTVELETHNFTREEVAERRMYLLNDNGQIDYFLNSAGGPLEFQYINMLSAHSSYWVLQDFVRFLVVEIGRPPGKSKTLPTLRAQKKRDHRRGTIA